MGKCDNDACLTPPERAGGLTPAAKRAIIVMRAMIVAGLTLTGFLTWMYYAADDNFRGFPLCGDCRSLFDSRWAMVHGVSAASLGFTAYLMLFVSTIRFPRCPWSRASGSFFVAALAGGGLWFIGVQVFALHQWCLWCTATHVVSIALAAIIWPIAMRNTRPAIIVSLIVAGLACAAATAMTQLRQTVDPATGEGSSELLAALPELDLSEQIVMGSPNAKKFVIEAMDFRCHRCAAGWPVVEQAKQLIGDDVAVVVLVTPLCAECNHYIANTPEGFEASCELAKLAWAVWLADSGKYIEYHRWLLAHQQCTVEEAQSKARELVGGGLDRAMANPVIEQRIARDVETAASLNLEQLPAMTAGRLRISAIPDDAQTLAMLWTTGLAPRKGNDE
ncbi:MAG: vitamin K epoxide reductase family protein [Phycisphaerales bacterium]